jgi:hypothetical protein
MNSVNYIYSYVHNGAWVFDDESRELDKEPFVEGADLLLDAMSGRDKYEYIDRFRWTDKTDTTARTTKLTSLRRTSRTQVRSGCVQHY